MSRTWRWFVPGYLWSILNTLVGLVLALIYRCHSWRWSEGCLEAIGGKHADGTTRIFGRPAAQTHGWLILYSEDRWRGSRAIRVHERVHVVQAFVGGPLFMLAYVACFAWSFASQGFTDWWAAYRKNPFEGAAYERQVRSGSLWGSVDAVEH